MLPGPEDTVSAPYYYPAPRNVWGIKVNGTETLKAPTSQSSVQQIFLKRSNFKDW
jgi:hypothetical protein